MPLEHGLSPPRAPAEGRSRGTCRDSEQQEHAGRAPKGPRGVLDGYCHAPRSSVRAPEPAAGLQRARYRYTNVVRAISAIAEGISSQQGTVGCPDQPLRAPRAPRLFFPRSLYTLGKAYACKARSERDSVWASAPGIGQPGSASKPLWHREETLKTIHGYAT
jgi:hypothetical protein